MKKLVLISAIFFIASGVFAQEKKDSSTIFIGKTKIIIISDDEKITIGDNDTLEVEDNESDSIKKNKFNGHWGGIDLGLNGYMYSNNSMSLKGDDRALSLNQSKSWNISLNFAEVNMKLVKNYIGITTGMGLQFNNYRFDRSTRLIGDSATLMYFSDTIKYNKNKLVATYLTVPLLLDFQVPVGGDDRIHLTVGAIGGLRLGSHTKQVFDLNGHENKEKQREDFHLSPFQYSVTARLGYNGVGVYVNYSLSSLFKDGEGPELYPWSAGLSFSF